MSYAWHVGLDIHLRCCSICILDAEGRTVKQQTIQGPWEQVVMALANLQGLWAVCYEASCGYGWWHERLRRLAAKVVVAHPGRLRLIYGSKRKCDRLDAQKLAKLLYLEMIPAVHVPDAATRSWRGLIEHRRRLVDRIAALKSQIKALLRGQGVVPVKGLWTRRGQAWLTALTWPEAGEALRRDVLQEELREGQARLQRLESAISAQPAEREAAITVLRTIPGVGRRTSEAFVAYVDDASRFGRSKSIGCYLGLTPCEDSSAGKHRMGHITKDGPATLRKLLTEAAWQASWRSPRVKAYFDRIQKGDPDRKKIAVVATAHYLARVMLAMLHSGEAWREESVPPAAAASAA